MNCTTRRLVEFAEAYSTKLTKLAALGNAAIVAQADIDANLLEQLQSTITKANDFISTATVGPGFASESEIPF